MDTTTIYNTNNFKIMILNEYRMLFKFHFPINDSDQYDVEYKLSANNQPKLEQLLEFINGKGQTFQVLDNLIMQDMMGGLYRVKVGIYKIYVRLDLDLFKGAVTSLLR